MAAAADQKLAWVTGATSFLGRHVARHLAREGMRVVGFGRRHLGEAEMLCWGLSAMEVGEFSTQLLIQGTKRHGPPAVVFHAIGSGSVQQAADDPAADCVRTIHSTEILLAFLAGLARGARLIYPSSAAVYGEAVTSPISEEVSPNPISHYGRAKLKVEELCRLRSLDRHLDVVIARLFSVYGPPQRKLLVGELAQRILCKEYPLRLGGTGHETRDFLYVTDAAAIIARLAALPGAAGTFNIGTGISTSTHDLAQQLAAAMGVRAAVEFSGQSRSGDPVHQQADPRRVLAVTGVGFTPLAEGLKKYAEWLLRDQTPHTGQGGDAAVNQ